MPRYDSEALVIKVLLRRDREVNASVANWTVTGLCHFHQLPIPRHHVPKFFESSNRSLLEHFPVRPLICLPFKLDRLVPAPLVADEFLIFGFGGIKLSELVALVVRCDIKGR